MAETLKEFLVSLGWENDEGQQKKFEGAIQSATTKALLLAKTLEELTQRTVETIRKTSEQFESLAYQAKYLNTTAEGIRGLSYAFETMGGNAQQAKAAIASLSQKLQEDTGFRAKLQAVFHINPDQDPVKILTQIGEVLDRQKNRDVKTWMRNQLGLPFDVSKILENYNSVIEKERELAKIRQESGIGPEDEKRHVEFQEHLERVMARVSALWDKFTASAAGDLQDPLSRFEQFLIDHGSEIVADLSRITTEVTRLAEPMAWLAEKADQAAKALGGWDRVIEGLVAAKGIKMLYGLVMGVASLGSLFGVGGAAAGGAAVAGGAVASGGLMAAALPWIAGILGVGAAGYGGYKLYQHFKGTGDTGAAGSDFSGNAIIVDGSVVSMSHPLPVIVTNNGAFGGSGSGSGEGRGDGGSSGAGGGSGGGGSGGGSGGDASYVGRGGGGKYSDKKSGLTPEQGAELLRSEGATVEEAIAIGSHMGGESQGIPWAHNPIGRDNSYGLWQINMLGAMGAQRRKLWGLSSNEQLKDPHINARAALWLFRHGGLSHWAGSNRFLNHLYTARVAAAARAYKGGQPDLTIHGHGGSSGGGGASGKIPAKTGGGPGSAGHLDQPLAFANLHGGFWDRTLGVLSGETPAAPGGVADSLGSVLHSLYEDMGTPENAGHDFKRLGVQIGKKIKDFVSRGVEAIMTSIETSAAEAKEDEFYRHHAGGMIGLRAHTTPHWAGALGLGGHQSIHNIGAHHYNMPMSISVSGVSDPRVTADMVNAHVDSTSKQWQAFLSSPIR